MYHLQLSPDQKKTAGRSASASTMLSEVCPGARRCGQARQRANALAHAVSVWSQPRGVPSEGETRRRLSLLDSTSEACSLPCLMSSVNSLGSSPKGLTASRGRPGSRRPFPRIASMLEAGFCGQRVGNFPTVVGVALPGSMALPCVGW